MIEILLASIAGILVSMLWQSNRQYREIMEMFEALGTMLGEEIDKCGKE